MSNLTKRIEKIEAGLPVLDTRELFRRRMHEAMEAENTFSGCSYHALLELWWAYMSGTEYVVQGLQLLDRFGLAEQLLGKDILARLRAGEDGIHYQDEIGVNDEGKQHLRDMFAGFLDTLWWIRRAAELPGAIE